eukprot:1137527-Pelagomonas_calceolata.AAC.3
MPVTQQICPLTQEVIPAIGTTPMDGTPSKRTRSHCKSAHHSPTHPAHTSIHPIPCPPRKMSIWRPLMLVSPLLTTLPPFRLVSLVHTVKILGMSLPANARAQLRNKNLDIHNNT